MATDPSRPTDPYRPPVEEREKSGIGKTLLILLAVAAIVLVVLFATGMLNMSTSGDLKTPEVSVSGGEVPSVDVQAAEVEVGTKTVTVEVPEVTVDKPSK